MLRFFIGLVLAQVAIALTVAILPAGNFYDRVLPVAFLIALLATVISLWFSTLSRQMADRRVHSLQKKFAAEREKLNQDAARAKDNLIKKTNRQIEVEARRAKTKANLKVWGAIAVAGGFGVIMLLTQFVTLGLLTLTAAGSAVGGYLVRARKEQDMLDGPDYKLIDAEVVDDEPQAPAQIDNQPADTNDIQADTENNPETQSRASG
jgi:hypothetical protein